MACGVIRIIYKVDISKMVFISFCKKSQFGISGCTCTHGRGTFGVHNTHNLAGRQAEGSLRRSTVAWVLGRLPRFGCNFHMEIEFPPALMWFSQLMREAWPLWPRGAHFYVDKQRMKRCFNALLGTVDTLQTHCPLD